MRNVFTLKDQIPKVSAMLTLQKHFNLADAKVGSGFDPPAIPFVSKSSTLKTENSQKFNLCTSATKKKFTYKFKDHTFANGFLKDMLE
eukprot:205191-Ditylum_brightwellii.AAC.1